MTFFTLQSPETQMLFTFDAVSNQISKGDFRFMTYNTNNIFQLIDKRRCIAKNTFLFSVISFSFLAITIGLVSLPQKALAQTQQKITNKDVIKMVKARLSVEIISARIKASKTEFDTSTTGLQELKKQGVPDSIVFVMLESQTITSPTINISNETEPQVVGNIKPKKSGVLRIGIVTTISTVLPEQDDAVRAQLYEMLYGNRETSAVEAVLLVEKLDRNIITEAKMTGCDYVLQMSLESTIQSTEKKGGSFISDVIRVGTETIGIPNRGGLPNKVTRITYEGYKIANSLQRSTALLDAITKATKKKDKVGISFKLVKVRNNEATIPQTVKERTAQKKQEPILQNLLVEVGNQILNSIPTP